MGEAHNYNYKIYDEEPKPHKKYIFENGQNNETVVLAIFENIFFSMRLRYLIVYFIISLKHYYSWKYLHC